MLHTNSINLTINIRTGNALPSTRSNKPDPLSRISTITASDFNFPKIKGK